MRIAVIGAGIGGLTAAAALNSDGHRVVVYERRTEPGSLGAGLTLFDNAFGALDAIGCGDAVRAVSSNVVARTGGGQRTPAGSWLVSVPPVLAPAVHTLHRADLHRALLDSVPESSLRLGQGAAISPAGDGTVTANGRTETFDLVVAADGLRSGCRTALGLDRGVRYAGCTAWRGVTRDRFDMDGEAGETWGRGRIFGLVPLPDGRAYWFATASTPAGGRSYDEKDCVTELFKSWHAPIGACIAATDSGAVLRHDLYDLRRLPVSYVRRRTVLLGDAAHGMTPNLGQGAGQAIEDGAVLALLLRGTGADPDTALARYDRIRRARTKSIWTRSRFMGRVAQTSHPAAATLRDALLRVAPPRLIVRASRDLTRWTAP